MMKRKIAFISEHASPLAALGGVDSGGQNVYVGELAKQLATLGYEIDIFTRWDDARLPEIVEWSAGVRVIHVKAGPIKFVRKEDLLPHMAEFTDNVITFSQRHAHPYRLFHANFWMSALVAADIKKKLGVPFVVTFHALGEVRKIHQGTADEFPSSRFEIEKRVAQEADRIIAECPQDEEDLKQFYGANREKIVTIPCGFNPHEFHPIDKLLARIILNLDPEETIILQLGRMVPRKGVDTAIQGVAHLIKNHKIKARLLVVGGESDEPDPQITPEIGRLQTVAKKEGISKQVTFVGRKGRDALKYYYSAADIFVTTPWYEPFGITPLESMACGTPVVGSEVGGIKYSVQDGRTGFLVPPKDPAALSEKLTEIIKNRKLWNYFRHNGLKRVNTSFTWAKIAASLSDVYQKILFNKELSEVEDEVQIVNRNFQTAIETYKKTPTLLRTNILEAAESITACLHNGGKILICGNGGSAADAQHFAAELVGHFLAPERKALSAIALTADTSVLTACSNDFSYEDVFARQVEALGRPGDILIGISTSGQSKNVSKALQVAREKGLTSIALLGKGGGEILDWADISLLVPSYDTQRVQEMHMTLIHTICELVEKQFVQAATVESTDAVPVLPNVDLDEWSEDKPDFPRRVPRLVKTLSKLAASVLFVIGRSWGS